MANKEEGIILSEKYGVNATLTKCWLCLKDMGIALLGKLPNDEKAPPFWIQKGYLCKDCETALKEGNNAVVEIEDIPEGKPQPENMESIRTGRMVIVKKGKLPLEAPISYMEHSLFSKLFDEFLVEN